MPAITSSRLRDVALYHHGTDLVERLRTVEEIQVQMRDAAVRAADEIDRLNARIQELEVALQGKPVSAVQ